MIEVLSSNQFSKASCSSVWSDGALMFLLDQMYKNKRDPK